MKKKINTKGKKFGKWTVLREVNAPYSGADKKRKTTLKCICECECGAIELIHKNNLLSGKSTGCLRCAKLPKDGMIGKTIGWLKVLSLDNSKKGRHFLCKCKCGNVLSIDSRVFVRTRRMACYNCEPKSCKLSIALKKEGSKKNMLTIKKFLFFSRVRGQYEAFYRVKCDCGNARIMHRTQMDHNISCGCLSTDRFGEKNPASKLKNKEAELIRELKTNNPNLSFSYLGKLFNISYSQISEIVKGNAYTD